MCLCAKEHGYSSSMVVPHGSYLLNCGSPNPDILQKSRDGLTDELQRCEKLGLTMFNFHPGMVQLILLHLKCLFVMKIHSFKFMEMRQAVYMYRYFPRGRLSEDENKILQQTMPDTCIIGKMCVAWSSGSIRHCPWYTTVKYCLFIRFAGSTCGEISVEDCLAKIAESINIAHKHTKYVIAGMCF